MSPVKFTGKQMRAMSGAWTFHQVAMFVWEVRRAVGDGWEWVTVPVREALIAQKALYVVTGSDRETVSVYAAHKLHLAMLVIAGLKMFEDTFDEEFDAEVAEVKS